MTENSPTSSKTYGGLHYVSAGYVPLPGSQQFGLPDACEFKDKRILPLHDMRPLPTIGQTLNTGDSESQLLINGYAAIKHPSVLHSAPYNYKSWHDPLVLQAVYVPEVKEMLKHITGAKKVIVEVLLLRCSTTGTQREFSLEPRNYVDKDLKEETNTGPTKAASSSDLSQREKAKPRKSGLPVIVGFSDSSGGVPPIPKVHLDYTPAGARTHIRFFHPIITTACSSIVEAEDRLLAANLALDSHYSTCASAPRWAIYSVWRPLRPVKRDPLVLGDKRSFARETYLEVDVMAPTMNSEGENQGMHVMGAYVGKWDEGHRWCYVSEQMPDEVLVIGLWDSDREKDGVGKGGAMHSSAEIVACESEESRESLELRCLAIW